MVSLHHRKRDGDSGGGSGEDGRGGPWAEIQARISRGWPYEDNGSVEGRWYSVCSTCRGNRSGVWIDSLWRLQRPFKLRSARGAGRRSSLIFRTPFAEEPFRFNGNH
ncbi:hypothetical protein DPMN_032357 [Dreissena polymorpha]|uniref:Uncharacterized protein n=1 Tax=Dreissena polymorpha TaxID=45954 RepID=A0A9D4M414_DREPO|nr:hypothetical protein DPMN_032357 [Dreissena polymorpha]